MSSAFVVNEIGELLALQRVFREAKFCTEPDDVEISDSPIVAKLFERVIASVLAQEVARDGEAARQRWANWLAIDESRDEWNASIRRATADARWATFTDDERIDYVKLLLSPFTVSPSIVAKFVLAVDRSRES